MERFLHSSFTMTCLLADLMVQIILSSTKPMNRLTASAISQYLVGLRLRLPNILQSQTGYDDCCWLGAFKMSSSRFPGTEFQEACVRIDILLVLELTVSLLNSPTSSRIPLQPEHRDRNQLLQVSISYKPSVCRNPAGSMDSTDSIGALREVTSYALDT